MLPMFTIAVQAVLISEPVRPVLQQSFAVDLWTRSIASGEGWSNVTWGAVAVNATLKAIAQDAVLKDNRSTHLIFQYGDVPSRPAGVYSLQPFFQYRVCFVYPLPGVAQGVPAETFEEALDVLWCPNGRNSNDGWCV